MAVGRGVFTDGLVPKKKCLRISYVVSLIFMDVSISSDDLDGNSDDLAVFSGGPGWQNGYGYFDGKF